MDITLIKPETQAKLRKPVIIGVCIIIILGAIWLVTHIVTTHDLSDTQYIDKISGTVVDTYSGSEVSDERIIFGIESIEDSLPGPAYGTIETLTGNFITYAYPDEQFSYKKNSLKENDDGYTLKIASNKRELVIKFYDVDDELQQLEIISGDTPIYNYNK